MMRRVVSWAAIASFALCFACTSRREPKPRSLQRAYVLKALDEQPMPIVESTKEGIRFLLPADTLLADGRGHHVELRIGRTPRSRHRLLR